ncbi:MAG: response regulator [SAR202 cluster bacterium]|jgi:CheY-like chemotaxis protein|nr:hypothetical protein [Chloroflexota bacterium]MQG58527.1 response regulator [SAR202 cluster bacterium]MQG67803.1 response regulator [SAR202 cluster bacterium]|tara:strand:+ start:370 stop:1005 length:636 start_codon:yes stop_codon:yes gene_type:complete
MLAVHDNGIGMRDDVKNRVFEPFFTTKGVGKGTGLGLSTCYGIVKQNGGFIKVKSEQGQGASFEAFFPAAKGAESSPKAEPDVNELPTGTETVLVVEDEPLVREIATSTLHRQGYNMLVAGNGLDALRIVDQSALGAISLVVTDVVMPLMGGKELAERLAECHPLIKVMFTSGYTDDQFSQAEMISERAAFVRKPFKPAELARKVREVLDR